MGSIIFKAIVVLFSGWLVGINNCFMIGSPYEVALGLTVVAAEVVLFVLLDLYQVKKMISDLSQPPTDTTPTADDLEEKE